MHMFNQHLYALHQAYKKHSPPGKLYRAGTYPGSPIYACTCGCWFFMAGQNTQIPVHGLAAGRYLAANPAIHASLEAYWHAIVPGLGYGAPWQAVLAAAKDHKGWVP